MKGKERFPTAPRQTGKWVKTTNKQKLVGADKVQKVRLAAMAPSLATRRSKGK